MLAAVVAVLRCPHCEQGLTRAPDGGLVCERGHRFDLARQGYVNLLHGAAPAGVETADMVAARARFQQAGHHEPLTRALIGAARDASRSMPRLVVDLGAGTGHHLAAVLDALDEGTAGLAVDLSKYAARRAARAHARAGAVVADGWAPLPIRDATADVVLNVFAPRNVPEIARILRPGGLLVVATPRSDHLAPLVERLGLLRVEPDKAERLDELLADIATPVDRRQVRWARELTRDDVAAVVAMGPSAWHTEAGAVTRHLDDLPDPVEVTFSVTVSSYHR